MSPQQPESSANPGTAARRAGWKAFLTHFWKRLWAPWANPVFVLYFFGIVVAVAGIGLWVTIVRFLLEPVADERSRTAALRNIFEGGATYAIAISATALADILLAKQELRTFNMLSLVLTFTVTACLAAAFSFPLFWPACLGCSIGVAISWVQWWIINYANKALDDDLQPSEITGGNPLGELTGTLEGFKT